MGSVNALICLTLSLQGEGGELHKKAHLKWDRTHGTWVGAEMV